MKEIDNKKNKRWFIKRKMIFNQTDLLRNLISMKINLYQTNGIVFKIDHAFQNLCLNLI